MRRIDDPPIPGMRRIRLNKRRWRFVRRYEPTKRSNAQRYASRLRAKGHTTRIIALAAFGILFQWEVHVMKQRGGE